MKMPNIETTKGTFTAHAHHAGKFVWADPSGFNWTIQDDDVDRAIAGLERGGEVLFYGGRSMVIMSVLPDKVIVQARDTAIKHDGCVAVLTSEGRRKFLDVLQQVKDRPDVKPQMDEAYRQWLAHRGIKNAQV